MLPFAVRSVTPRPHELIVRVPKQYLRGVLPAWSAEEDGTGEPGCQVDGIPGLRARLTRGQVIPARPGLPGRIIIPSPADRARRAALIAVDMHGGESDVCLPWLTHPRDWHPAEERFAGAFSQHCATGGAPGSRLASQILRRLPGLCPAPRAYYHDMWFNRFGDTCAIQFEWAFGATPAVLLGRLLCPVLGPGAQVALFEGRSWRTALFTGLLCQPRPSVTRCAGHAGHAGDDGTRPPPANATTSAARHSLSHDHEVTLEY